MRRIHFLFLRVGCLLVVTVLGQSVAVSQAAPGERHAVLAALRSLYGRASNSKPEFALTTDHVLRPFFSLDGSLTRISVEPRSTGEKAAPLPKSEWDSVLANLNTVKPLGDFEEEVPVFVGGGRAQGEQRYQHGYVAVVEILEPTPVGVESAHIYYLHPVTGIPRISKSSKPQDGFNFYLVCVGQGAYIAPEEEFRKVWSKPAVERTLLLAGPTQNRCLIP